MTCRGCRSARLDPVLEMAPMPLAGAFAATEAEAKAATKYPLTWLLCADCGLVNVAPDIPDELIYSTYSYAASTVPALRRHHADLAAILKARYPAGTRLLEIGGNDGVLLNQLPANWHLINCDPSDVAQRAWMAGGGVSNRQYGLAGMPFNGWDYPPGEFDVVTSSNAFAHFSRIGDALDGVARVLKPRGEFWIEVHDLDATLATGQWDTIYHEHAVEWSVESLRANLAPRGLSLRGLDFLPLHGGLIRARFRKDGSDETPPRLRRNFAGLARAYATRKAPRLPKGSVAYGAAARASVYLNQVDTGVRYVVDGSTLRAGKYVPGIGLRVVTPAEFAADNPPAALITAWNHAADIRAKHPAYDRWVTAW